MFLRSVVPVVSRLCRPTSWIKDTRASFRMFGNWKAPPPCQTGDSVDDVDTPALIVDLDKMEFNIQEMMKDITKYPGVSVRPHMKAHKCPQIATIQMEHGAVGVCCQTLVESEAMVYAAGIKDVFLTNQMIGKSKLDRFAALAKHSSVSLCVDDQQNIKDIDEAAKKAGVKIGCVVDVHVGQYRCGVEPGKPVVELAEEIMSCKHVWFKGIHCYHGLNQHIRKTEDRSKAVEDVVDLVKETLKALSERNIKCDYVTGGGTGSYKYEAASQVYTEVQPGSYIFMDADYGRNLAENGQFAKQYKHSLFVLSTIQSAPSDRAVLDAGTKAVSLDSGPPLFLDYPDLTYIGGGDEHGVVVATNQFKVGDRVWLIPGHCDPTVNLYDWLVGVRDGKVEKLWPVLGRGPGV